MSLNRLNLKKKDNIFLKDVIFGAKKIEIVKSG